jgi:hypothetical protein
MSIEAMKQALAKFEHLWEIGIDAEYKVELLPEIQALRQAIEQAEKQEPEQEPVGWFDWDAKREIWVQVYPHTHGKPLYDEPPRKEWVGLLWDDMPEEYAGDRSFLQGAKWALAKLKEKNGGV